MQYHPTKFGLGIRNNVKKNVPASVSGTQTKYQSKPTMHVNRIQDGCRIHCKVTNHTILIGISFANILSKKAEEFESKQ